MQADIILVRSVFTLIFVIAGLLIQPIPDTFSKQVGFPAGARLLSALLGAALAAGIIFFELRIRKASLKTLIGAAVGSILGIIGASLMGFLITAQH